MIGAGSMAAIAGYLLLGPVLWHRENSIYRIGWEEVPPFQVKGGDGAPTGFAVDLVSEAARRRGIRLEWVWSPGSEASLRSGAVDLWPLITITPERRKVIHISDPYLKHQHYLFVRANSSYLQVRDLANATIALADLPINQRLVRRVLPNARVMTRPSLKESIESVCGGLADASFADEFGGMSTALGGLACTNQPLRMIWIPTLETELGIGATFRARPVADEIRDEIGVMGRGGALSPIITRWGYDLPQSMGAMNALLAADRLGRRLVYLVAFLGCLAAAAIFTAIYIRRQRNRIERESAERRRVETALLASERRFRELLEGVQLVAIMTERNAGITFCNDYTLSLTGWSRQEVIGCPPQDLLDDGDFRSLAQGLDSSPELMELGPWEGTLLTKAGQQLAIQWTGTVVRDTAGRAVGFARLGEDVTELKRLRAKAANRESAERFRAIFQHAAVGVAQTDLEGIVKLVNDRYCALVGLPREELLERSVFSYTYGEDIEPQRAHIHRLMVGEASSFSMEKRYVRKGGSLVWARVNGSLIRDTDNRPKHFIFVVEDITERKKVESALRESEERFRNMADTAPVLIWVSGPDGLCTFFNKGWLTFTGRTLEEELGNGWTDGIHSEDRDRCVATYSEAFEARRPFQMEYRLRASDGNYRWLRDEGVPRFDTERRFAGYIGSCLDVTDLKREHEAAAARQKLESVGVLAGGIAHDFNNLLGSIMADAELALADLPKSAARTGIERIQTVGLRAAEIVRELLAYAGKEPAVYEAIDVSSVVGEMVVLLRVSISKRAALQLDLPGNLPAVRANAAQIRQVVLNLVTNASEALGSDTGVITVRTSVARAHPELLTGSEPEGSAGDCVLLEVSDTGKGLTDDVLACIYDPFFSTKFAGRGLGLAVVQGIVRGHGGVIEVTSAPGKGTTFRILLPSTTQAAVSETIKEPAPAREATGAPWTVLFVEDEPSLQMPVSIALRRSGYTVIEASDGVTAVELFRANSSSIDVVLLDMTLPGKSGPEVYAQLQEIQPRVKVVLTTAHSHQAALNKLMGREGWAFIRKPYQLSDLIDLLQRICSGSASRAGAGPRF